jgi:hypothetical protein
MMYSELMKSLVAPQLTKSPVGCARSLALNGTDDVLPGKPPLPLQAINMLKRVYLRSRLGGRGLCYCSRSWLGDSEGLRHLDRNRGRGCTSHYYR